MNDETFTAPIPTLVLADMRKHFARLAWGARRGTYQWNLSWEQFVELWHPHWADRRRRKLVICREDHTKPYELGNVWIDTRSNQVKQLWKNYRTRLNRPDPAPEA